MAKVTGLSGNEIYCLALKQYSAGELVVGNSVNSWAFWVRSAPGSPASWVARCRR